MAKIKKIKVADTIYDICDADAVHSHQTIKQDGVTGATANRYGVCSTAVGTAAKTVSITKGTFSLETGARVTVKFGSKNTANNPTLNVNSTGAKNIFHNGAQITSGTNKGMLYGTVDFVYDGTQWHLVGNYVDTDTNTHNSHKINSGKKSDGSTDIVSTTASSGDITLGDSGVTAGTYRSVTVNAKGIVVAGSSTDADTNTWRKVQLNGTDKLGTGTNTKPLNIKAGSNMTITESNGTFTFTATDTNTDTNQKVKAGSVTFAANDEVNIVAGKNVTVTGDATNKQITISATDTNTDTKNTAGSTDSSKKLYLIGAETQAANPQTYSHDTAYVGTDGCLYSGGSKVLTSHQSIYNLTLKGAGTTVTTFDPNAAANSLDIVAGTNVTVTPDATNKKITIAATDTWRPIGTGATDAAAGNHTHSNYLGKTTYEWNKEFAAGENGAISLGRYNMYDSQLTFDITSTTTQSLSGKLVIATQNGNLCQAKVFGDASGTLVSKLIIYQSAISGSRSWIEVFCNFDGWSKNKVHIYAVALNSATVEKQMTSVTISSGTPATANVTKGDKKWTGTIVNDISHSHDVSIAASSGTNELTLAHGTKYALTAGGQSFIFTTPGDSNTHNSHKINSGKKSNGSTDIISAAASSGDIILGDSGVTAGTYKRVTVNAKGIVVSGDNTDADTHYTKYLQIKGNGTEAVKFTQDSNKSLNIKPGTNVSISAASGEITISATDTNTWRPIGTGANDAAAGNHTHTTNSTFYLDNNNYVHATGFYAQSDKRLKENIKEFTPQKSILDLPVVEFDYIETKSHNIGCIAQDLQEICPEIVNETEEGYLSIEEDKLVYLLLLEVKKLKAETEILKNKLEKQSN